MTEERKIRAFKVIGPRYRLSLERLVFRDMIAISKYLKSRFGNKISAGEAYRSVYTKSADVRLPFWKTITLFEIFIISNEVFLGEKRFEILNTYLKLGN